MTDEELQARIEKGFKGKEPDEQAYRMVFDALNREPEFRLSPDFANSIIRSLRPEKSASRDMALFYAGLVSFAVAMGVAIVLTDFRINWGVLKFISGYPGLLAFGALFILALQWIDKRFVRKRFV